MNIDNILELLKDNIDEDSYTKYLLNLKYDIANSTDTKVILIATNLFIANFIKRKLIDDIQNAFYTLYNIEPIIKIVTSKITIVNTPLKIEEKALQEIDEKPTIIDDIPTGNSSIDKSFKTTILNPLFTFNNFIVGVSNEMPYTVSKAVSITPAKQYNPLFIYGDTGLGKTHLLQAIGNEAIKNGKNIIYVTCEQFVNTFTNSIRSRTMENFRNYYRNCDMLLIDDIQFLSGKDATQTEFFNTFNELNVDGKQIVLTADKIPSKIAGIEERLKSRFLSGLSTSIETPKLETKIKIIKKKCELNNIVLDNDIVNFIATNFDNSIREIEGVLVNISAHCRFLNKSIDLELVKKTISNQLLAIDNEITISKIISLVAKELNLKPTDIKKRRTKDATFARTIVIYLNKELAHNTTAQTAKEFALKDVSSISKAIKRAEELLNIDEHYKLMIEDFKTKLKV
ncbi:MAG: chromosomal replication initiator protein DnaA [Campylobacterota bacterium]|nr:chromosomal replication initiator protein DnaA [Campylobacterota bacterium]